MTITVNNDKSRAAFNRLLLAKQIYLHGLDHSNKAGGLNKMVAVHNFHNAIEIALRAIFLHYEIRAEKALNIDFESMLKEIDNYQNFKDKGIKLPYRQEIRNLNQIRNLVEHHAVEPEATTMEDFRVFSRRFLQIICGTYFDVDFDKISPINMIEDELLEKLLFKSLMYIDKDQVEQSLSLIRVAFNWASESIIAFLPRDKIPGKFVNGGGFVEYPEIDRTIQKATFYSALLSTGIGLVDYKQFLSYTPHIDFTLNGSPDIQWGSQQVNIEYAKWAHDFVVTTIVHWQVLGLVPKVPDWCRVAAQAIIDKENDTHETGLSISIS